MKFVGSRLLVAVVASAITALLFTITLASASAPSTYPGTIYGQTCTVIGTVHLCSGNGPCRPVHNPLGHVGQAHNGYLECKYP
jgi:hypothetical protein